MKLSIILQMLTMTKNRYFQFVERCSNTFINDIQSFQYPNKHPDKDILKDMFNFQSFHKKIKARYHLAEVAGAGGDFDKALRILEWLTKHTYYNGMQWMITRDNPVNILRHSYNRGFCGSINCRAKAYAYADCLIAIGIKALPICLLRATVFNGKPSLASHFMVHVYINETNNWVVMDSSFNTYFEDDKGNLLDYFGLIETVKKKSYSIKGYNFNGSNSRCYDRYVNDFVEATMEHIAVWETNIRAKKPYRVNEMHYIISPEGKDLNTEINSSKPLVYNLINPNELCKTIKDS